MLVAAALVAALVTAPVVALPAAAQAAPGTPGGQVAQRAVVLPPSGAQPFSIGNRVFVDDGSDGGGGFNASQRNNGVQDSNERGVNGVRVDLYVDLNTNGQADADEFVRYDVTAGGEPGGGRPGGDRNGYYLFDDLPQGTYLVVVPASEFAVGKPLGGHHSSSFNGTGTVGATGAVATPATDLDDNGIEPAGRRPDVSGVTSSAVTFTDGQTVVTGETDLSLEADPGPPTNEVGANDPTGWDGPGSIGRRTAGSQRDDASNVAVDLGFTPPMSIGNRIWLDDATDPAQWSPGGSRNNALIDSTDDGNLATAGLQSPGIAGVDVQLYADENNNSVVDPGDTLVATTTSGATGYYLFDGLAAGNYLVRVPSTEFATGQPLNGLLSSFDAVAQTNPTNQTDGNDNGIDNANPAANGIVTRQVALVTLSESTSEADPNPQTQADRGRFGETDADSDLTIDLGFARPATRIGDQVWRDDHPTNQALRNNGVLDTGETTVAGVEVALYRDLNANSVVDAGEDTGLRDTTDDAGAYDFSNLPPGRYVIAIAEANFNAGGPLDNAISSRSSAPNPVAADNQVDNNDNGIDTFVAGVGIVSSPIQLGYGLEPVTETTTCFCNNHGERNSDSDFTVDFGFYVPMSLGNRVWLDDSANPTAVGTTRDDGVLDAAADDLDNPNLAGTQGLGVVGVTVRLYRDLDADGVVDAGEDTGRTTTTNASGYYLFDGISRGSYVVGVEASNFASGARLSGFRSSTNAAPPADDDLDSRDKGVGRTPNATYGIISPSITLGYASPTTGSEPVDETDPTPQTQANRGANGERNDFSNLTVDFGFVRANTAPTAANDGYPTAYGTALTVSAPGVLGNDSDLEDDALTASLVSGPAHGTLTLDADGSFAYTPSAGYSGADAFTYRASDGTLLSATATVALTVLADAVSPTVGLDAPAGPVAGAFEIAVLFSEPVTGLSEDDFVVANATIALSGTGASYQLVVTPTATGNVTVQLPADSASDATGNGNVASATLTRVADLDVPTVVLSAPAGPFRGTLTVTATFSEPVTGFDVDDLTVGNGTASDVVGSGASYTFTVTPTADGAVTVDVPDAAATDAAGNASTASATLSREYDGTRPDVELSSAPGPVGVTFTVTATFSEPVTGFESADVVVGNGAAADVVGSGASYTFTVTPAADGPVTVDVSAAAAADAAGNTSTAGPTLTRTADVTRPDVELDGPAGPQRAPFRVGVVFSEPVTGLLAGDLVVDNGTASDLQGEGLQGAAYSVLVTPSAQGAVTVRVPADAASDAADNGNTVSADLVRVFDSVRPTVTLDAPVGPVGGPFTVTITLSEPAGDLTAADLDVVGGTMSDLTGSGTSYAVDVTPTVDGPVTLTVVAGAATDAAGNTSLATSISRTADLTGPAATLSTTAADPTAAASVTVDVTFSEPVTGLDLADPTATGGTLSALTGSGTTYAVTLTFDPAGDGATVGLPAGAATDEAGNPSEAAADLTVAHDGAAPALTITRGPGQADPVRVGQVVFDVTADEPVSDLAAADVVLDGTAGATAATVRRTGAATFEVTATGMTARGTVELSVAAGAVHDPAGNPSTAAGPLAIAWSTTRPPAVGILFDNRCLAGGLGGTIGLRLTPDVPTTVTMTSSDPGLVRPADVVVTGRGDGDLRALVTVRPRAGRSGTATVTITATNAAGSDRRTFRVVVGTDGPDLVVGTSRPDLVLARGGDDVVRGAGERDLVCGGAGDDRLYGGAGRDALYGGTGDDLLVGGRLSDRLVGGPGRDVLRGGPGHNEVSPRVLLD